MTKYGWEIADEVQRFVSGSADMQFVPISAFEAERARSAKLEQENDLLRLDAQKLYADYMDRGAAMRETGDMMRSLYASTARIQREMFGPAGVKHMGDVLAELDAERSWSKKLLAVLKDQKRLLNYPEDSFLSKTIDEYEARHD